MFSKFQDRLNLAVKNSIPIIENARRSVSGELTPSSPASNNSYASALDTQPKIDSELEEVESLNESLMESTQESKNSTESQRLTHPLEGPPTPPTPSKQSLEENNEAKLPDIIIKKLEKLKKYENSYPELARAYKSQLANLKAIDQVLQDMTPIQSCTDVEGLENHLKNLDSKNKMVMEELTRINKAQQESQKESIGFKKELDELKKSASQHQEFNFISAISAINENLNAQSVALEDPVIIVLRGFFNSFEKKFGKRLLEVEDPDIVEKARKLDSVQNELNQTTQSKKDLENKVESLFSELEDYKGQIANSKQENQQLKEKAQGLESQVDELSNSASKANDLEKQLDELKNINKENQQLKEKVQGLESQVDELSNSASKANDLEKQLDELKETNKRTIADLEDKLEKSLSSKPAQVSPSPTTNSKKKKKGKSNNSNTNSIVSTSADEISQIKLQLQHSNDNLSYIHQALDNVHSKILDNKLPISISDPNAQIELSKLKEASENIIKQWNDAHDENTKSKKRGDVMNNLMNDFKKQLEAKNQEISDLKLSSNNSTKSEQRPLDCEKCTEFESKLEKVNIENEELKRNLLDSKDSLDQAQNRKDQLQNMVEELETQVFALNETNNREGSIKLQKISKDLETREEEIANLKMELHEVQAKSEKFQSEINKLTSSGKELIDQNSRLTKEIDAATESKKDFENQIKSLNEKISNLMDEHKKTIQKLEDSVNGSKSALKTCQKQVKQLESEKKDLEAELSKLSTKSKELETKLNKAQADYTELKTKSSSNDQEISKLQEKNQEYSNNNSELNSQLEVTKQKAEQLNQTNVKNEQKLEQLQKELSQTKSQLEELKIISEEREDLVLDTKKELSNFKSKAQLLEQELCTSRDLFESKSLELDQIRNELSTARQQIQSIQSNSEDKDQKYIIQISQLESDIEAIRDQAKERISTLESDLTKFKTDYESVKESLSIKTSELSDLQENYGQAQLKLSEVDTKLKSTESELAQVDSNSQNYNELKETLENERKEKDMQIEQAQMRESHLRNLNRDLKDEIRRLQRAGGNHSTSIGSSPSQTPSSPKNIHRISESMANPIDDGAPVNLEYLRHVVLRFFEDKDRRPQLTTILSHLLKFSPNETQRLSQIAS